MMAIRKKLGARYVAYFATSRVDDDALIYKNMHYLVSARSLTDIFDSVRRLAKQYNATVPRGALMTRGAWLYPMRDFRASAITTDKTIIGYVGTDVPIYLYKETQ